MIERLIQLAELKEQNRLSQKRFIKEALVMILSMKGQDLILMKRAEVEAINQQIHTIEAKGFFGKLRFLFRRKP